MPSLPIPTGFPGFEKIKPGETKEVLVKLKAPAEEDMGEDDSDFEVVAIDGVPVGYDDDGDVTMEPDSDKDDESFMGMMGKPNRRARQDREADAEFAL